MSGIVLLAVIGLYVYVLIRISDACTRSIKPANLRTFARGSFMAVMLALPLADEIVGAFQFNALCKAGAVLTIDAEKAKGKTVKLVIEPSNEVMPSTAIRILHSHYLFTDIATNEMVAKFDEYVAEGGWFIRALGISNGDSPLLIGSPGCAPVLGAERTAKVYGFRLTN